MCPWSRRITYKGVGPMPYFETYIKDPLVEGMSS